jgi:hypothetical protein
VIHINNLRKILSNISIPVLFTDDKCILTISNPINFQTNIKEVLKHLNKWFNLNLLLQNSDKTNFIHFKTRNTCGLDMKDKYNNRLIANTPYTSFLGITIKNMLHWKSHMDQLFPTLREACYAVRVLKLFVTQEILTMVYYAYFHLIVNNDIIFWGDSPYSINNFRLQKQAIRIIMSTRNRDSCRKLFKALKIPPLQSQCIFLLLCFVVKNMD